MFPDLPQTYTLPHRSLDLHFWMHSQWKSDFFFFKPSQIINYNVKEKKKILQATLLSEPNKVNITYWQLYVKSFGVFFLVYFSGTFRALWLHYFSFWIFPWMIRMSIVLNDILFIDVCFCSLSTVIWVVPFNKVYKYLYFYFVFHLRIFFSPIHFFQIHRVEGP